MIKPKFIRLMTPKFTVSFPYIVNPAPVLEGNETLHPKYTITAIWRPEGFTTSDKTKWKDMLTAIDTECKIRFSKSYKELKELNSLGGNFKLVPKDGRTKEDLKGFGDGTLFASLSTRMRPGVVDADRNIIPVEACLDEIYPGCVCRATITIYSFNDKGKGVALGLLNLQKLADGDRLDGRIDAAEDFMEAEDPLS